MSEKTPIPWSLEDSVESLPDEELKLCFYVIALADLNSEVDLQVRMGKMTKEAGEEVKRQAAQKFRAKVATLSEEWQSHPGVRVADEHQQIVSDLQQTIKMVKLTTRIIDIEKKYANLVLSERARAQLFWPQK